jgi:hypothetical protein
MRIQKDKTPKKKKMRIILFFLQTLIRQGKIEGNRLYGECTPQREFKMSHKPTAFAAFGKMILREKKAEYDAYISANLPKRVGAHLIFISNYKNSHMDEWEAFKIKWESLHPMECEDKAVIQDLEHICATFLHSSLKDEWNEFCSNIEGESTDWPLFKIYISDLVNDFYADD